MALKESFEVVGPEELKLSWEGFDLTEEEQEEGKPEKTDAERRRAIKKKLNDYHFAVNQESITNESLKEVSLNKVVPDRVNAMGIISGVTFVKAFYDGTSKTGKIKMGHPVVFDMVHGDGVTGINEGWAGDEYKVMGIALKDYEEVTEAVTEGEEDLRGEIPVQFNPPPVIDTVTRKFVHASTVGTLPAAFGGPSQLYGPLVDFPESPAVLLAKSYGNYFDADNADEQNPITREHQKIFFYDNAIVCKVDESNELTETEEKISIGNNTSMPVTYPYYGWVNKVGNKWLIDRQEQQDDLEIGFSWNFFFDSDNNVCRHNKVLFARPGYNAVVDPINGNASFEFISWVRTNAYDIYIAQPGLYHIEMSVRLYFPFNLALMRNDLKTTTSSGSPSHTHDYYYPGCIPFKFGYLLNFEGKSGSPLVPGDSIVSSPGIIENVIQTNTFDNAIHEFSGSTTIQTFLLNEHGGPYTRISPFISIKDQTGVLVDVTNCRLNVQSMKIIIKPAGGNGFYWSGPGMNPYLGEKTDMNPTGFQWWGGGPEPTSMFDKYGQKL